MVGFYECGAQKQKYTTFFTFGDDGGAVEEKRLTEQNLDSRF